MHNLTWYRYLRCRLEQPCTCSESESLARGPQESGFQTRPTGAPDVRTFGVLNTHTWRNYSLTDLGAWLLKASDRTFAWRWQSLVDTLRIQTESLSVSHPSDPHSLLGLAALWSGSLSGMCCGACEGTEGVKGGRGTGLEGTKGSSCRVTGAWLSLQQVPRVSPRLEWGGAGNCSSYSLAFGAQPPAVCQHAFRRRQAPTVLLPLGSRTLGIPVVCCLRIAPCSGAWAAELCPLTLAAPALYSCWGLLSWNRAATTVK